MRAGIETAAYLRPLITFCFCFARDQKSDLPDTTKRGAIPMTGWLLIFYA
jgi:hypothetical protein